MIKLHLTSFDSFINFYFKKPSQDKNIALHQIISQRLDSRTLSLWLNVHRVNKGLTELVNYRATPWLVTPLHICAMVRNVEAAKLLLAGGAKLGLRDVNHNTPLHIAAILADRTMLEYLKEEAVKQDPDIIRVQNTRKATAEMIMKSLVPPKIYQDEECVCYLQEDKKALRCFSAKEFLGETQCHYSNSMAVTSRVLEELWCMVIRTQEDFVSEVLFPHFERLRVRSKIKPPSLFVQKKHNQFCLKAKEAISRGTLLLASGGTLTLQVNAQKLNKAPDYANESLFIQDGRPNAKKIVIQVNGIDQDHFLALENVMEGELICIHDRKHQGKWLLQQTDKAKIQTFWASLNLESEIIKYHAMYTRIIDVDQWPSIDEYLKCLSRREQVLFIFESPRVMAHFILNKLIPEDQIEVLLYKEASPLQRYLGWDDSFKIYKEFLIDVFELAQLDFCPLSAHIHAFFKRSFDRYFTILVFQAIQIFLHQPCLQEGILSLSAWTEFERALTSSLEIKQFLMNILPDIKNPLKADKAEEVIRQVMQGQSRREKEYLLYASLHLGEGIYLKLRELLEVD